MKNEQQILSAKWRQIDGFNFRVIKMCCALRFGGKNVQISVEKVLIKNLIEKFVSFSNSSLNDVFRRWRLKCIQLLVFNFNEKGMFLPT